jgi:uncharacterized protein YjbJ (UPF0337 family)
MNSNQFKGGLKELAGKAQERLGRLTRNPFQQEEGVEMQNKGRAQVHRGDLEEFAKAELHDIEFAKRAEIWANGRG